MLEQRVVGTPPTVPARPEAVRLAVLHWFARLVAALHRAWADPMVRRGTLGMGLVSAGSLTPAFLPPKAPIISQLHLEWLGEGVGRFAATVLIIAGLALLVDAWLRMRPRDGRRVPSLTWVFWSLPVLLAPPLFSRDAYSYAAQGLIVQRGLDPYAYGPYWVPGQYADQVDPMWLLTPAPYGPLALQVQHFIVAITGDNAYLAAVLMRLPAVAAVALLAWTLPRLAKRFGVSPSHALWLAVLNPLVIMHFVGGAHGDAVMVALVTLALYVASLGRFWVGAALIAAAASYKQTGALALVGVIGMAMQADGTAGLGASARLRSLIRHGVTLTLVTVASFTAITVLTGLGWGWTSNLSVPASLRSLIAPPTFVGASIEWFMNLAGMPLATAAAAVPIAQSIGLLVGLVSISVIVWRVAPRKPVVAAAGALLVLVASGPVIHPWYLLWGGVLLGAVRLSERAIRAVIFVTLFFVTYGAVDATVSNGTWALGLSAAVWMIGRFVVSRRRTGDALPERALQPVGVPAA
ncbi:polyprenol phosphomannose-dependent alpha 1,6 mannosyltransferase MptB [Humibacillus xanthopallidus]|uniref:Alpha-1,6-mannosyltransferase/alpha-1, 6-mannosyltransferase n=1 Tax=Humibacillus xanthopallidus TaxID=412689 RepID=A0A543I0P4_9MICO|nr:polyprenol phosphomannose-dependent alpha 1,6 mannosyltransferase MptB [Humibacillus xanthopallidus]TQM64163.1 alpha-1,6-mannosyltransferase/alpha-1,6-mannosyltransferase [Humibacillus xanthopallidus]